MFHEAVVWGVAFALGAVDALVAYRIRPSRPTAVLASVLTDGLAVRRTFEVSSGDMPIPEALAALG